MWDNGTTDMPTLFILNIRIMAQHVIDLKGSPEEILNEVKALLNLYNLSSVELDKKEKKSKWDWDLEPTFGWNSIKWIKYLISKEFWIDSYTSYNSVYAGDQDVIILHYKPFEAKN